MLAEITGNKGVVAFIAVHFGELVIVIPDNDLAAAISVVVGAKDVISDAAMHFGRKPLSGIENVITAIAPKRHFIVGVSAHQEVTLVRAEDHFKLTKAVCATTRFG